jgi:hypothetical protein
MARVTGTVAIETCQTSPTCKVNCGTPCNTNLWWCAWPHWTRCNSVACTKQTNLPVPINNHCDGVMWFVICGTSIEGATHIYECGPDPAVKHAAAPTCAPSTNQNIIACVNLNAFASICNGCNPLTYGVLRTTAVTA